ncbi:hypothetical protein EHO61_12680 [Leptospira fluminis]|uniref:Uncharacterized protein n=1 Tax=Leptospira fluminis TaxID=2484979 RepID=A0A4R9GM28_9LEPT|nr:hypothetical protein [Leptospira fluminis]TGK17262.1 hypothetical protein EHO61_12680 [Leptospira fluminis]
MSPYRQVLYLSFNWYKDRFGKDILFRNGISVGPILSCSAWVAFSTLYGEFHRLHKKLEPDGSLRLPSDATRLQRKVASKIATKLTETEPMRLKSEAVLLSDERFVNWVLGISRYSGVFRKVQKLTRPFLNGRKTLYYSDWTYSKRVSGDHSGLVLNSKNFMKGAYVSISTADLQEAEGVFSERLPDIITSDSLSEVLKSIGVKWERDLLDLCCEYLHENYATNRGNFVLNYAYQKELLEYYKPETVVLPGEVVEPYAIILQIAQEMGIQKIFMLDGYPILPLYPLLQNCDGSDFLFDRFVCYGEANRDLFKIRGVSEDKCILTDTPLVDWHQDRTESEIYDVIVMTWVVFSLNPDCIVPSPKSTLREALLAMMDLGMKRIAVKVKSEMEIDYVQDILQELDLQADILTGFFYMHVKKARMIVGGISTGVIEAFLQSIPYYLFEPLDNGYSDEIINESVLLNLSRVARDREELKALIREGRVACISDREYVLGSKN